MTKKNIPVTTVFGIIIAVQLAFGIWTVVAVAEKGGKAKPLCLKNHADSEH